MKNKKNPNRWTKKQRTSVFALVLLIPVVIAGVYFGYLKFVYLNDVANQASIAQVRELIILSSDNLKKDVPVEPKTGDLYFPESRLYLPNPKSNQKLTYSWYLDDISGQEELSVSLAQVPGTTELYSARNIEELFNSVPKLQSCSRGVRITYYTPPTDIEPKIKLEHQINLQNGKIAYLSTEDSCPDLDEVINLLKNIQSY